MNKTFYLITALILLPVFVSAQRWKAERTSVVFGIGMSHFMGDLGGGKKDAAHFFGVRDMDFVTTRPVVQVGFRYRLLEELAVKPIITYALLAGKDAASGNDGREMRNLSFRSHIWEFGGQLEYAFIKEKQNPRYSFSSLRASRNLSVYVILGGGMLRYNPKTKLDGKWVELRPLHTEGQGQEPYLYYEHYLDTIPVKVTPDKEYGKFAAQITIGLGAKFNIDRRWSIGLEITNRYTTTDYIDDAHDRYYNYTTGYLDSDGVRQIPDAPAEESYILSDRHMIKDPETGEVTNATQYVTGKTMRGEPTYNDAYIITTISAHYKFKNTVRGLPKF